jgi:hypothetical protein
VTQVAATQRPSVGLLCGFLQGLQKRDGALADALLDEAVDHATLGAWLPILQACVVIDEKGLTRLHRALELGQAPINSFFGLAYGRACDVIPGPEFKRLLLAIGQKPGGIPVAMDILSMRLHSDGSNKKESVPEVAEAGRALLAGYEFHRKDNRAPREDYELGVIIRASLAGDVGKPISRRLCRNFLAATARYDVHAYEYDDLMKGLFQVHPADVLDELLAGDKEAQCNSVRLMNDLLRFGKGPMDAVPDDIILRWCDRDPEVRYPFVAAIALLFKPTENEEPQEWTNLTRELLLKAFNKGAVFKEIVDRLHPTSWSGSLASQLESRLKLLDRLDLGDMPALVGLLDEAKAVLKNRVDLERQRESKEDRARSGRFE